MTTSDESEKLADLQRYLKQLKATDSADIGQLAEILATKLWTIEQNQKLVLEKLDELLRRTPPPESRRSAFN